MIEPIGEDVRRELSRFGPQAGMADLVRLWPDVVGEQIARNAWPARFTRDGTLLVHAKDSVWAYELGQREAEIRERLGSLVPARVRFMPGPLPEPALEPSRSTMTVPPPPPEAVAEAARLAAGIGDEELREIAAKAIALSLARAGSGRGFW